jgi:hypothetical protein
MSVPVWQHRRGQFNHDWLKNQFLLALGNFINLLDDEIENEELETSFVPIVLPQWEDHRDEVASLLADFDQEMSPRTLFQSSPLAQCDQDTRQWLGDVVHTLWLVKNPVHECIKGASTRLREADQAYELLQRQLKDCSNTRSAPAMRPLRGLFVEFYRACQKLAKAIEQFPSDVRIT